MNCGNPFWLILAAGHQEYLLACIYQILRANQSEALLIIVALEFILEIISGKPVASDSSAPGVFCFDIVFPNYLSLIIFATIWGG